MVPKESLTEYTAGLSAFSFELLHRKEGLGNHIYGSIASLCLMKGLISFEELQKLGL